MLDIIILGFMTSLTKYLITEVNSEECTKNRKILYYILIPICIIIVIGICWYLLRVLVFAWHNPPPND